MTTNVSTEVTVVEAPRRLRDAWVALAGLSAVFLVEMLDNSILNVALPTIGRDLQASTTALQWVTGAYSVVFGGLMLVFGAAADRVGRRRMMLAGLALLAVASLAIAFVSTAQELIAVRALTGVAAAVTAPGSMALAFRLFPTESLRVRAITLISSVGMIGLATGPTLGGFVLAVAPWQVLLLVNVPIAVLAILGVRFGVAADDPAQLHRDPVDVGGALLGTATIVLALVAPTLFVNEGTETWTPWAATVAAVAAAVAFVARERSARHPLLDLHLVARPLVSSGLAYKAAAGLATAGLGYLVTLQLQFEWGWPPVLAALGMLPQVAVLLATGPFVNPFVERVGFDRAAWLGAAAIVCGLAVYGVFGGFGYVAVAIALALVAAGLRVSGVVAAMNVFRGLPANRTSIGAALTDTASEVTSGIGIAVAGTILAGLFTGDIVAPHWNALQAGEFRTAVMIGGLVLTVMSAALVGWAMLRTRGAADGPADAADPVSPKWTVTPVSADLVRGAAELEPTEHGLLPHRLPAGARAQLPAGYFRTAEALPSGVRLAFHTTANTIELDTLRTRIGERGGPPRADGCYDLLVDGHLAAQAGGTGGGVREVDPETGAAETRNGPVGTVVFTGLADGAKDVEIWLPHNEITELVAVRSDAPLTVMPAGVRRIWCHHGSSISAGADAASPTTTWPALAAADGGVELTNLGFEGNAVLDPFVARTIRDSAADLISIKIGVNLVGDDLMHPRVFGPAVHGFLDTIRDGHPRTPLLVVSSLHCPRVEDGPPPADPDRLTLPGTRAALARIVAERAATDPNLSYVDGRDLYGAADAAEHPLPDGVHPGPATHRLIGERFAALAFGPGGPFARG